MSREISCFCFTKSYCTMKIFLLISFALTAISSTRSSNSSEALDITTLLNNTIAKKFQNMNPATINKLILSLENLNSFSFETSGDCDLGSYESNYFFTGVTVTGPVKAESATIRQGLLRDRVFISFTNLSIEMKGYLAETRDAAHVGFVRSVNFKNISIELRSILPDFNFSKNVPYPYHVNFIHYENYESHYIYSPWLHQNLTKDTQYELESLAKTCLPSLLMYSLRGNENFKRTLHAAFCLSSEEEITFKRKNYFFIPNITSLGRTLSNITITGMHNFDSHSFAENSGLTVSTLTIKDIRGTTNLHYDGRNFTIFPLYFEVDCISITVDQKQRSINVTPHNYTVIDTKTNVSLTEYQSKWVMEGIQLAIASFIMPSMKYNRNRTQPTDSLEEHPIVKISTKLSQQFEGSTIQKLYDTWNITIPESFKAESSIQMESHTYNISIDAKPETALKLYPDYIQCSLYNHLELDYEIPTWFGKISVFNTTYEFDEIDFKMPDIIIKVFKLNNINHFELRPFVILDVELLSYTYSFSDYDQWKIAQKAQEMTISLIKKTVTLFAELLLSLPLDYCTQPVKIFDDFLPFYADHELPFRVPDGKIAKHFMIPKINDVIITEWTKSPSAFVSIYCQDFVNGTNGSMKTYYVKLQLAEAKIKMNFNDSLVPFDELHLTLTSLEVRNYTDGREVVVGLDSSRPWKYDSQNNETISLSSSKIASIEMKLQSILGECFNNLTSIVF